MNQAHNSPSILRSIGAVLAGLLAVIVLSTATATDMALHASGVYPPMFQSMGMHLWVLATAYRCVYSVLGAYITARLAPDRPMRHVIVLGAIGVAISTIGVVATWNRGPEFGPKWYPLGLVVLAMPLSWAGGILREMQLRARDDGRTEENLKITRQ